ncbi:hypothetical protein AX15_007590 [Amanita polypyramis BW_CC]|nr:hypothetical protein AX15_007590 [Amanita polypyramis BW_CC]
MTDIKLKFSPCSLSESGSFKLLELPPDICSLVEASLETANSPGLFIKGQPNEDAVLCTRERTYTIRSVVLSNTILVVSPSENGGTSLDIRDQVGDILELVPCVPRLHKLDLLLRGRTYDETHAGMDVDSQIPGSGLTYGQAKREIQASGNELDRALKDRRILVINGELRPILPGYLHQVLELLLNLLIALSLPHDDAPIDELAPALATDHEVPHTVTDQVMSWFGEVSGGKWKMDVKAVVKEIGLNLLREHRHESIEQNFLLTSWKASVGDTYESAVSLDLLSGNFITSNELGSTMLTYFPATALPVEPAARFADLFLARPRWKEGEIASFLTDIAVNTKERDKLLLKYCRSITESGSVWYTARTQYSG